MKKILSKSDLLKCQFCKKKFIPDQSAVMFSKKKKNYVWDRHTYKPDCECYPKDIRFSVG